MWRLAESFEVFNSSLVQSVAEIFPRKNTGKLLEFSLEPPEAKVLIIMIDTQHSQAVAYFFRMLVKWQYPSLLCLNECQVCAMEDG